MPNTFKKLQNIVGQQLTINPQLIKLKSNFIKDLGVDSLELIELVLTVEYEFDITIDDQSASKIRTFEDLYNCVKKNIK